MSYLHNEMNVNCLLCYSIVYLPSDDVPGLAITESSNKKEAVEAYLWQFILL